MVAAEKVSGLVKEVSEVPGRDPVVGGVVDSGVVVETPDDVIGEGVVPEDVTPDEVTPEDVVPVVVGGANGFVASGDTSFGSNGIIGDVPKSTSFLGGFGGDFFNGEIFGRPVIL